VIQSFDIALSVSHKVTDVISCFQRGKYIAALSDRVYFFNNSSLTAQTGVPLASGGLLVSYFVKSCFVLYGRSATVFDLATGMITENYSFNDADRQCLQPAEYLTCAVIGTVVPYCI
jgi:hypothetical protein